MSPEPKNQHVPNPVNEATLQTIADQVLAIAAQLAELMHKHEESRTMLGAYQALLLKTLTSIERVERLLERTQDRVALLEAENTRTLTRLAALEERTPRPKRKARK